MSHFTFVGSLAGFVEETAGEVAHVDQLSGQDRQDRPKSDGF